MASIKKRGKTWYYVVEGPRHPVTNKREQITKGGFKREKDAELAAARLELEIADGLYVKESNVSFKDYSTQWLKWYAAGVITVKKPKKASVRQRKYQIATLLNYFASIKVSKIKRDAYQNALIEMREEMAYETVKGIHSTASMIFLRAMQDGVIKIDPTEYAKVPSDDEDDQLPKYMEKEELSEFLELAKRRGMDTDYVVFLTLAYTGLRAGELCALKWSNLDVKERTLSVAGTLYNPEDLSNSYEITAPKTKASRRTIDIDEFIVSELMSLRSIQNEFKMSHRKNWHDGDFIFARMDKPRNAKSLPYGYPLKRRTIERRMDRLLQWTATQSAYTPHSLRHTHTSLCAEAGVSLEAIMQRLGHKDDRTTRTIYLHVTRAVRREAAAKFGSLMAGVIKM